MKRGAAVLLVALLCLPTVQAWHLSALFADPQEGEEVDIRQRVLATSTRNIDNGVAGNLLTHTFAWDPEFSYADRGHVIRAQITYTPVFPAGSNGAWNVTVAKEQTGFLAGCSIRVETIDPVGLTLDVLPNYPHYQWDCLFTQSTKVHFHYHTIYVNRTLLSGAPTAMSAETISVKIETEDIVVLSMPTEFEAATGLTGTEFFAILGLALAGMTVALVAQKPLARVPAALFVMVLGLLLLSFQESAIVVLLAALLLLFAAVSSISTGLELWRSKKPRSSQPPSFFG